MVARARSFAMAYVTAPDRPSARKLARLVLHKKLAACANLLPAESLYWWKGNIEEAREIVVIFKTKRSLLRSLIASVRAAHPYEVPCAVAYGMIEGSLPYLDWISDATG